MLICLAALWSLGCGDATSGGELTAPGPQSAVGRAFASCLAHAGATVVRSPSELAFAKGTSLYGDAPSAGTDIVSVAKGFASVSFMPDEGTWRIYTLSELARGADPDYDAIWARLFNQPEVFDVVAVVSPGPPSSAAQRCTNISSDPST